MISKLIVTLITRKVLIAALEADRHNVEVGVVVRASGESVEHLAVDRGHRISIIEEIGRDTRDC